MPIKNKQRAQQEKRLAANVRQAKQNKADLRAAPGKAGKQVGQKKPSGGKKPGGFGLSMRKRFFGRTDTPQTAQQTIPYKAMRQDGICQVTDRLFTKTVRFNDINYQLAQNEDRVQIFENYCDFLNCATRSYTNTIPLTKSLRALDHVVLKIGGFQ